MSEKLFFTRTNKLLTMEAIYNIKTRQLSIIGGGILPFRVNVPQDQEDDYWNTVNDLRGAPLYDINLFNYGEETNLQYVNLVDDGDGGLECGDDYQLAELTIINN